MLRSELAKQVVEEISKPVQLAALALQVGVSVGVSAGVPDAAFNSEMAKRDGTPVETALRQADMAMYWGLNFSGRQISDPKLALRILDILTRASFPPDRLMIEVTESAVVQRLEDAKATLQELRDVGVRIALDDFGTGYSGLYHLRELELDTIKIDRTFVGQMLEKPQEARIVKAIVSLGHALGLKTTAEGIQSEDMVGRLLKLGCDTGQGYCSDSLSPPRS